MGSPSKRYEGEFELFVGKQHGEMSVRKPHAKSVGLRLTNEDQDVLRDNLSAYSQFCEANVRVFEVSKLKRNPDGTTVKPQPKQPALTPAVFQKLVKEHTGNFVVLEGEAKKEGFTYKYIYLAALEEDPEFGKSSNPTSVWTGAKS
jgi:hypothetical protein